MEHKILGKGETLLLIHGFAISYPIWRRIQQKIVDAGYKLIIIDLLDTNNDKNEHEYIDQCISGIEKIRRAQKVKRISIIGYSLGAIFAEKYFSSYKDNVNLVINIFPPILTRTRKRFLDILITFATSFNFFWEIVLSGKILYFLIILLGFNLRQNKESKYWFEIISKSKIKTMTLWLKIVNSYKQLPNNKKIINIIAKNDWAASNRKTREGDVVLNCSHSGIITESEKVAKAIINILSSLNANSKQS